MKQKVAAVETVGFGRASGREVRLAALLDREEIGRVLLAYAHAIDRRDWALYRSLFLDTVEMDFSASIGAGGGLRAYAADDWVAGARAFFEHLPATQHLNFPTRIDLDGDTARAATTLHARHFRPNGRGGPVQVMAGHYDTWLVRTSGGWRIRKVVQHVAWNEGNWHVFELAAGAGEAG